MVSDENRNDVGPEQDPSSGKEPDASEAVVSESATVDRGQTPDGESDDPAGDTPRKHGKRGLKDTLEQKEEMVSKLNQDVEALRVEARDLKDKWLRSAAELENFRRRSRKEWELLQQRTKAEIILDVLAVVDDFERAFSVAGDRDDDFIRGIRLIYNKLKSSLEKFGVRKMEALHTPFDPAYHMAVAQIERDGADSNHVIEIVQEGYCLGDFVVRPAQVIIAK